MPGESDHESQLDSFSREERHSALLRILDKEGHRLPRDGMNHNMHMHSFFSYNAEGWSPSRIAWRAREAGLYAAGLCDFDVLDGAEEFLDAGLELGLRTTASLETRAFCDALEDAEISSPGEPGVTYIMGAGFAGKPAHGTPQAAGLEAYRTRARDRNLALVRRVNSQLPDIALDYEADVLPLTPEGGATERHIVSAYIRQSREKLEHADRVADYWGSILGQDLEAMALLLTDLPRLEEAVRARLVKRGGIGYEQPSRDTFPPVDEFIAWALSCEAMPMITWLDGTSEGERDGKALLELFCAKGAVALNIIPDRNWNLRDATERETKVRNLHAIVEAAEDMGLPINIGTEMNKLGLPFVDDLDVPALRPHKQVFLRGARIMVGQTLLKRYAEFSYVGASCREEFPDLKRRNDFFESVGALPPLKKDQSEDLLKLGPERAYLWFHDAIAGLEM